MNAAASTLRRWTSTTSGSSTRRFTPPTPSGNGDASFTGSYQFGFQDSYYDQFQQQSAEWANEDVVPALLAKWQPGPAVRLAWCRVHNGEFMQPRRSTGYVAIDQAPGLTFLGRAGDSLFLEVTGASTPPGYDPTGNGNGDPSPPGFRYDLPRDEAVALPQVLKPKTPTTSYPGGLPSYPFFAYYEPGARLFPASWFAPALAVAGTLRARCAYDLALRWYRRAFDPLQYDCTWVHCPDGTRPHRPRPQGPRPQGHDHGHAGTTPTGTTVGLEPDAVVRGGSTPSATTHATGTPRRMLRRLDVTERRAEPGRALLPDARRGRGRPDALPPVAGGVPAGTHHV